MTNLNFRLQNGNLESETGTEVTYNDSTKTIQQTTAPSTSNDIVNFNYVNSYFYGYPLSLTPPTDGQIPAWDAASSQWIFSTGGGGGGINSNI